MVFVACGLNHKTAPLAVREQIALSTNESQMLEYLMDQPGVHEVALLSTCNRTEIYCETEAPADVLPRLFSAQNIHLSAIEPYCYMHHEQAGIKHLLRVASGLDSMMLGEPQILGQMKQAYHIASQTGSIGTHLGQLFPYIFKASKRVRHVSGIGQNPISVAFAAAQLITQQFPDMTALRVLLIGSGETASLVAKYLHQQGVSQFLVANRTEATAQHLANLYGGTSVPVVDIANRLAEADVIVSATTCPLPFITKQMVEKAMARRHLPLFLLDLAVPRDIEPDVKDIKTVQLYNMDDLNQYVESGMQKRQLAALKAEELIEKEVHEYQLLSRTRRAKHVIRGYRARMEEIASLELARAKQKLLAGQMQEDVLTEFSNRLVNKLLHLPTLGLRQAALDEQHALLDLAHTIISQSHEPQT